MENKENKKIIDIARGVPCKEQLELSTPILEVLNKNSNFKSLDDIETRNYGGLDGIYECKKLFSYITNSDPSNIFVCGNSFYLTYDIIHITNRNIMRPVFFQDYLIKKCIYFYVFARINT